MDFDRIRTFIMAYGYETSDKLEKIYEEAVEHEVPVIRPDARDLIRFLLTVKKPARILEIGTAVGYSALFMAEVQRKNGIEPDIITMELDDDRYQTACANVKSIGENGITLLKGDAAGLLEDMCIENTDSFDFVFIDAAKAQYPVYFEKVMKLINPGGFIVTDNILESGKVLESHFLVEKRDRTIHDKLREYLDKLRNDERLETVLLPTGDGVAVSMVKD